MLCFECYNALKVHSTYHVTLLSISKDHVDCLEILHSTGATLSVKECEIAALFGSIQCLKYLRHKTCYWSKKLSLFSTIGGNVDCLEFCYYNDCILNSDILQLSCKYGNISCLKFAFDKNCYWRGDEPYYAVYNGHSFCLSFCIKNKCPCNLQKCLQIALQNNNDQCVQICLRHRANFDIDNHVVQKNVYALFAAKTIIKSLKSVSRLRCQQRCKIIFKELIEKTCHPDRYLNWCIDEDERKEIVYSQ